MIKLFQNATFDLCSTQLYVVMRRIDDRKSSHANKNEKVFLKSKCRSQTLTFLMIRKLHHINCLWQFIWFWKSVGATWPAYKILCTQ